MRIFLGIEIPSDIKKRVAKLADNLRLYSSYLRLTRIDNLHFTLKFLGEQNDFTIGKIREITKKTIENMSIFDIEINKSGLFGGIRNPRILWLGEDNTNFTNIASIVHNKLDIFRHEDKKPICHLTIGRIKNMPPDKAIEVLNLCKDFVGKNSLRFTVRNVYLYKSNLLRSGAVYEKIDKFNLKEK